MSAPTASPLAVAHPPAARLDFATSFLALGSGVIWSFGVLTNRLAKHTDAWQYLIWRSLAIIVVVELLSRRRGARSPLARAYTSGWRMLVGCACLLVASLGFVYAVKNTTAANASFLASLTPLFAVLFARVVLGEKLTKATAIAILLAFTGLSIMVAADIGTGSMVGNIAAVLSSIGLAGYAVCVRSDPSTDWSPVMPGYASMMIVLCSVVTAVKGNTFLPPAHDTALAVFHGGVLIVFGTLVFNAASRKTPAVAMTVFAQSEMVFAPIWVYLWLHEAPKRWTLVGGAIVLTAVVSLAVADARTRSRPA